jgi:EpsI family protein
VAAGARLAEILAEEDELGRSVVMKTLVALAFIGLNFYTYHYLATNPVYPERRSFDEFPLELGEWSCAGRNFMDEKTERNLGVSDYLICRFTTPENPVGVEVYVGYHASQVREEGGGASETSIHPPAHCLPGSGWDIISNQTVPLEFEALPGRSPTAKRLIISRGKARQLVYYWYQSRGRVISQDWRKVAFVGLDRALRGRTDGALVRFTVPMPRPDVTEADAAFAELAPLVLEQLPDYVPN